MKRLALFASGNGSNAQAIVEYFSANPEIRIVRILSNKQDAFVLQRAAALHVPTTVFTRADFYDTQMITRMMEEEKVDLIVLAGFLWLLPPSLIQAFPDRIINIHPALLPKYGGKGMYGDRVHAAVIAAGETESGITIHFVDEHYDEGRIIFQATCPVETTDTPDTLAARIHRLEHAHFPVVVEQVVNSL